MSNEIYILLDSEHIVWQVAIECVINYGGRYFGGGGGRQWATGLRADDRSVLNGCTRMMNKPVND